MKKYRLDPKQAVSRKISTHNAFRDDRSHAKRYANMPKKMTNPAIPPTLPRHPPITCIVNRATSSEATRS